MDCYARTIISGSYLTRAGRNKLDGSLESARGAGNEKAAKNLLAIRIAGALLLAISGVMCFHWAQRKTYGAA